MKKKKTIGPRGQAPYGYDHGLEGLVINPDQAEVVRLIYDLFSIYQRKETVAEKLNVLGKVTNRGKAFSYGNIEKCLNSTAVKGLWSRSKGTITQTCPIIISPEQWERTQRLLQHLKLHPYPRHSVFLFHNYVFCNHCEKLMLEKTSKSKNTIGIEMVQRRYICERNHQRVHILENELEKEWIKKVNLISKKHKASVVRQAMKLWPNLSAEDKRFVVDKLVIRITISQGGSVGIVFKGENFVPQ